MRNCAFFWKALYLPGPVLLSRYFMSGIVPPPSTMVVNNTTTRVVVTNTWLKQVRKSDRHIHTEHNAYKSELRAFGKMKE